MNVDLNPIWWAGVLVLGLAVGSLELRSRGTVGGRICLPGGGCPVEDEGPQWSMVEGGLLLLGSLDMVGMGSTWVVVARSWRLTGLVLAGPIEGDLESEAEMFVLQWLWTAGQLEEDWPL